MEPPIADDHRRAISPLSMREAEVLTWVSQGLTNKEVAVKLFLSPHTIQTHLQHIYNKTHTRNRSEAVWLSKNNGWI